MVAAALLGSVTAGQAAILTWDGADLATTGAQGGVGTWNTNTTANWWDGAANVVWPALGGTDDDAVFGGTAGAVTIGTGGVTANDLTFNTTGYVISGATLTLNGTTPTITTAASVNATISSVVAGSAGLTKAGAGTLVLNGVNTYSGVTTLSAGTLSIAADSGLGTAPASATPGSIVFNGGTLNLTAGFQTTVNRGVLINAGGGTLNGGSGNFGFAGLVAGTGTLTITGAGTYITGSSLHTYSGGTILSNGTTTVFQSTSDGVGGLLTRGPFGTGTLSLRGGQLRASTAAGTYLIGNRISFEADTTFNEVATSNAFELGGNVVLTASRTLTQNSLGGVRISGVISESAALSGLTKAGPATLTLSGANTYTGVTSLTGGVLNVTALNNYGVAGPLGQRASSSEAATIIGLRFAGGTLQYTGSTAQSTDRQIRIGTGGGTIDASGSVAAATVTFAYNGANTDLFETAGPRTLTLTGTNTGANTFNIGLTDQNASTGKTSLVKTGAGTWVLNGVNTYTGGTTISGGTLVMARTDVLPASSTILISSTTGAGTLRLATDTSVPAWTIGSSSSNQGTVVSDRATAGAALTHALGLAQFGSNTYNFLAGANVTSGTAAISFSSADLSAGTASTTTLNPTTANLIIVGGVSIATNNFAKTLSLGGTSTGNVIQGAIVNGLNTLSLSKQGAGTWELRGANTYTGTTTVSAGVLRIARTSALYNATTTSWTAANIKVTGGTFALNVGGTGEFASTDVTTLLANLGGANGGTAGGFGAGSAIGFDTTNASGGAFTVGDLIANPTGAGAGTLGVTKIGTGTLTLSGANTYTGLTTVTAGTLQAGVAGVFTNKGGLSLSGAGTFDLGGFNASFTTLASASTNLITNNSASTASSNATAVGTPSGTGIYVDALTLSSSDQTVAARITDGSVRETQLVISNANSATNLAGVTNTSNSFSGGLVLLNTGSGTRLRLNSAITGTPFGTGPVIVGQAATDKAQILLDAATAVTLANDVFVNTAVGTDVPGTLRVDTAGHVLSGRITANLAPVRVYSTSGTASLTLSGQVVGPQGLTVESSAATFTTTLSASNSYAGPTTITGGTLRVSSDGNLGAVPGAASAGNIAINGGTLASTGTFTISSNRGIALGSATASTGGTIDVASAQTLTYGGVIANNGGTNSLTKTGAGTLRLTGASTYAGGTTISGGTLTLARVDALPVPATIGISSTVGSGTLVLATDTSVNAWSIGASSNNPGTIVSDRATAGAGLTHVLGAALLGNNTYAFQAGGNVTGGTAGISFASLDLAAGNAGTVLLNPTTASLTIVGGVSIASNNFAKTLGLGGTSAGNAVQGVIANGINTLAVTKSGTGTWTLSGANTYTGVTTINEGVLSVATIGNGGAAGNLGQATNAAGNLVLGGGTLQYTGATASTDRAFTLTAGTTSTVNVTTAATVLTLSGASATTTGALTKTGPGTLTLSGANTYSGGTNINGGTVTSTREAVSGGAAALGSSVPANLVTIGNGGVLTGSINNWLDNTNLAAGGTNARTVQVNTGGILRGAANSTITGLGNITLNGGTLEVTNGLVQGGWNGAFTLGGDLTVSGTTASAITTAAGAGAGANLQMSNGSNGVGGTRTFRVNDVTSSAASDLVVSANLANGTILKEGAGTLELIAGATGTATPVTWTVNAGTLSLAATGGTGRVRGVLTVNAGGTVVTTGDGTGLGYGTSKPDKVVINGGTVTSAGTMHVWNLTGGIEMTGGTLQSNQGVSTTTGNRLEWQNTALTTFASANTATIAGRIYLRTDGGTGLSVNVADGAAANDLLISAAITQGTSTTPGAGTGQTLTKSGSGTLTLSGVNSFTGTTTVSAGMLRLTNNLALQGSAFNTASAGSLDLTDAAINTPTLGGLVGDAVTGQNLALPANVTGLTLNPATGLSHSFLRDITGGATGLSVTKSGAGTQTLGGINTYSGVTTFGAGVLNVGSLTDYGVAGSLGQRAASSEASGDIGLRFTGGTLQYTGATAQSTNRQIRIGTSGGTIDASGSAPGATVTFAYNGTNTDLFDTGGPRTLTLTGTNTGANTFALGLTDQNASTGKTGLTKSGNGTWVLTGTHSYTGATSITGGTLNLATSIAASATTLNGATAVLTGSGTAGAVTLTAGTIRPGDGSATGVLNVGTLSIAAGQSLGFVLGAPGTSSRVAAASLTLPASGAPLKVSLTDNADAGGNGRLADGTYSLVSYSDTLTAGNPAFGRTLNVVTSPLTNRAYAFANTGAANGAVTVTVGRQSPVILRDSFARTGALGGTTPEVAASSAAGATWTSAAAISTGAADRSVSFNPLSQDSAYLGFLPQAGNVYTLSANMTPAGAVDTNWRALGFANSAPPTTSINNNATLAWMLHRNSESGQSFFGGGTGNGVAHSAAVGGSEQTNTIVLDTRNGLASATLHFLVNGVAQRAAVTGFDATAIANVVIGNYLTGGAVKDLSLTAGSTWLPVVGSNSWDNAANWSAGYRPGAAETIAVFAPFLGVVGQTVTLDADQTVGQLAFANSIPGGGGLTVAQGVAGTLTFDNGAAGARISNDFGVNRISAPVVLNDALTVDVATGSLEMSASIAQTGGARGLTKNGNGLLILSGANTYAGTTTVNAGTLRLVGTASAHAASALVINAGATLDLRASLTVDSLAFNGATTANIAATGTSASLLSANALSTDNLTLNITGASPGSWASGTYPLFAYGTLTGAGFGGIQLGNVEGTTSRMLSRTLIDTGSQISLVVVNDTPKWTGVVSNELDNAYGDWWNDTGNWRLLASAETTDFLNGDAVVFDDTATGVTSINVDFPVTPSAVVFDNSAKDYVLDSLSGFGIGGTGSLTKRGAGRLEIWNQNTYSGPTLIEGGTLALIGPTGSLGATSALTLAGGSLNLGGSNRTMASVSITSAGPSGVDTLANGGIFAASYAVSNATGNAIISAGLLESGTAGLTKSGAGTATLSGANTYVGSTLVSEGTLALAGSGTLGSGSALSFLGGRIDLGGTTQTVGAVVFSVPNSSDATLANGGLRGASYAVSNTTGSLVISAHLLANANAGVAKTGAGTLTLSGNNTFTGALTIAANSGLVTLSGDNSGRPAGAQGLTVVNNGATLRLQANEGNTVAGVSTALSSERTAAQPLLLNNGGTLQLRADSSVTFAGANSFGGLGGSTITIDVGRVTSQGSGHTLTLAPGGFVVWNTTLNVTGADGYVLRLPAITSSGIGSATYNPTTANLSLGTYTADAAVTLGLAGTSTGNVVTGAITNGTGTVSVTKSNSGMWTLSGANTYTGTTTISAGTLRVGAADTFTNKGALAMSGTGVFDLNGFDAAFAGNVPAGVTTNLITDNAGGSGTSSLTFRQTTNAGVTTAALIADGPSRKLGIVLVNANGSQQFTNAANTFSGGLTLLHSTDGTRVQVASVPVNTIVSGVLTASPYGTGPITIGQVATDKAGIFVSAASTTIANAIVFNTGLGTDRAGIRYDSTGNTLSGTITANNAAATFSTNSTGAVTLSGRVTGANGLTLDNAFGTTITVTLNNATGVANDYQGETRIAGTRGVLVLGAADQIPNGASAGNLTASGTLRLQGFSETINGLSGTGNVTTTVAGASVLTLGDNDATASFSGTITESAGTVRVVKIGTGTQTLATGTNTFTGGLVIRNGVIQANNSTVLGGAGGNSGTITLGDTSGSNAAGLRAGAAITISNPVVLATNAFAGVLSIGTTGDFAVTYSGGVTGNNDLTVSNDGTGLLTVGSAGLNHTGRLTKVGAGTLTLSASNTFTGSTTVSGGTLALSGASNNNIASSSGISLGNGTTLSMVGLTASTLTLAGGQTLTATGTAATVTGTALTMSGNNSISTTGGTLTLPRLNVTGDGNQFTGGNVVNNGAANARALVIGSLTNGSLSITGGSISTAAAQLDDVIGNAADGTLTVSGGSYVGPARTIVGLNSSAGTSTLTVSGYGSVNINLLQLSAANSVVNLDGGALTAQQVIDLDNQGATGSSNTTFNFNGGVLRAAAGANVAFLTGLTNAYVKSGGATIDTNGQNITLGQALLADTVSTGGGLTKTGNGILTLSGVSTYAGATYVRNGTIALIAGNDRLATAGVVTLGDVATTGKLVLGDAATARNQTLAGLTATGLGGNVVGAAATNSTLTLNIASGTNTFSGTLGGGGANENNLALVKTGSGTLVLDAANTFAGNVTVTAGLLSVSHSDALGTGAKTLALQGANRRLELTGGITLGSHISMNLQTNTNNGVISSSGANEVRGSISLTGGGSSVGSDGTSALTLSGDITANGGNGLNLHGSSTAANRVSGAIADGTSTMTLTKQGSGTWTLSGTNTYSGATSILAGTLRVGAGATSGTLGSGNVVNAGTLVFDRSDDLVVANAISGAGSLTQAGIGGTLTLSGNNTYTGATTVTGGALNAAAGALANTSGITVTGAALSAVDYPSSATLTLDASATAVVSGANLNLSGAVTNNGSANSALNFTASTGTITLASLAGSGKTRFGRDAAITGGVSSGEVTVVGALSADISGGTVNTGALSGAITGGTVTVGGVATIGSITAGTVNLNGATASVATLTAGTINLGATALSVQSGMFTGLLAGAQGSLIKTSNGTLTLSGANTFGGGTTVSAGTLVIGQAGSLGSGAITVASGASLDLANFSVSNVISAASGASIINGPSTASVTTTGSQSVDTVLTGAGGLTKSDGGELTLTTPNFFTGGVSATTAGAVISAAHLADGSSSLGASALNDPTKLVLGNGATLEFTGTTATTTSRSFTIAGSAVLAVDAAAAPLAFSAASIMALDPADPTPQLKLVANNSGVNRFEAQISADDLAAGRGLSSLVIDGTGQWVIGGAANRFKGDVRMEVGGGATLGFEAGALGTGSTYVSSVIEVGNGSKLSWAGNNNTDDISGRLSVPAGATAKLDLGDNNVTFASAPSVGTGGSLEKQGTGTLKIAATVNAPTLNVAVTGGRLAVNGRLGNITLATGATLGGSGTIGTATVASGATVAPGNSPGLLTGTSIVQNGGSVFEWEVQNATSTSGYDRINLTGDLDLRGANPGSRVVFKVVSRLGAGDGNTVGNPLNFAPPGGAASIRTFQFGQVGGVLLNSGQNISDVFAFDVTDFRYSDGSASNAGLWSINWDSGTGAITVTAVPEPSTYGLGLGALALAAAALRRRRRRSTPS